MLTLQLLAEHGEEDGEVDGAAGLLDHGLQLLVLHVDLACRAREREMGRERETEREGARERSA